MRYAPTINLKNKMEESSENISDEKDYSTSLQPSEKVSEEVSGNFYLFGIISIASTCFKGMPVLCAIFYTLINKNQSKK